MLLHAYPGHAAGSFISPALFYLYLAFFVVPREEKYMKDKFGKEYEKFSNRYASVPSAVHQWFTHTEPVELPPGCVGCVDSEIEIGCAWLPRNPRTWLNPLRPANRAPSQQPASHRGGSRLFSLQVHYLFIHVVRC